LNVIYLADGQEDMHYVF